MLRCSECGTIIDLNIPEHSEIICCPECEIELEFADDIHFTLQLGPSEE